ncbi:MAG: hypothetical protein QW416_07010 [Candidatus Nitrosocaldaceae archaeon]
MSSLSIELKDEDESISGIVKIFYKGKFDGIQINAYMLGSSELVQFIEANGKRISMPTRLYIARNDIVDNQIRFKVSRYKGKARFRVAIIEEHKEIESEIIFH